MTLLTAIEPSDKHILGDAVRSIAWSPSGRTMAVGADGRVLLAGNARLTAPIGPDPIDCAWIEADRVAVADGVLGVVIAGGRSIDVVEHPGVLQVAAPSPRGDASTAERYGLAVGGAGIRILHADPGGMMRPTTIDTGPVRTVAHAGGSIWLAGGADGLVVVDVSLGGVDQRIELPGIVSIAAAAGVGRVAAADVTGAIHVLDVADLEHGTRLTGYPDAVRHLGIGSRGEVVVACADDELTWWNVADDGSVADEPECGVGHDAPITSCAVGARGFVATGDLDGLVRLWSPLLRDLPVGAIDVGGEVTVLSWCPSGQRLAIGTADGDVLIADVEAGELL